MKIVIIGGTGLIGSKLAVVLRGRGHEVLAASPNTGVDTVTGAGLRDALVGAKVVVDVANSPSFEDQAVMDFFETSGSNLLAAARAAGVKHHVVLSIVGTERVRSGYMRAKLRQEQLVEASGLPYTIVHSTQFFEFAGGIAQSSARGDAIHVSTALFQPIAADDAVAALADITLGTPLNGKVEIAGPERVRMSDLVRTYLQETKDARPVVADPAAPYFGATLDDGSLVPASGARIAATRFDAWLAQRRSTPAV